MAIERNDRSFSNIFDDIDIHTIPTKYIMGVTIVLNTGETIEIPSEILESMESAEDIVAGIERENIADVGIQINYDAIEHDVTSSMSTVLDDLFNNNNND